MSAGNIKRDKLKLIKRQKDEGNVPEEINEQEVWLGTCISCSVHHRDLCRTYIFVCVHMYHIAGIFRGVKFLWFSWLRGEP